ncbi:MAG: PAS domain S-box protein [Nitrospirota bacterium]
MVRKKISRRATSLRRTGNSPRKADATSKKPSATRKKSPPASSESRLSLKKERDFISAVLSTAGALVIVLDPQGRIVSFNKACEKLTGYSFDEVKGRPFWDFLLIPEEMSPVRAVFKKLASGHFPNTFENHWICRDGSRRLISWSNTALLDSRNTVDYVIGTGIDVTEQRLAEEALRKAHEVLEMRVSQRTEELRRLNRELQVQLTERSKTESALVEHAKMLDSFFKDTITPLALLDRNFNFVRVNEAYARSCEKNTMDFAGHNHFEFFPHEENEKIFRQVVETKRPYQTLAKPFSFPDHPEWGVTYWDWTLTPLPDDTGEAEYLVFSLQDVTQRTRAEKRLHATNRILQLFTVRSSRKEYLDSVVRLLQEWTDCCCIGIRLMDKEGNIPYEAYTGFAGEFWESENCLSTKEHQCACIRVVLQRPDPQDFPAMTHFGSFVTNNSVKFMQGLSKKERARFRGKCIQNGFLSTAIIPVRYEDQVIGTIQLADKKEGMIPPDRIEFAESIAPLIGEAIHRFSADEELTRYRTHLEELVKERTELLDIANRGLREEIIVRRQAERLLHDALEESERSRKEIAALLEAAHAVMKYQDFRDAASAIFDSCKKLLGAGSGYIALLSKDGTENDVLFLDAGSTPCTVSPDLPMPVRGLRAEAYRRATVVYENAFAGSRWEQFMPAGHVRLENVLFAPLTYENSVVGLLGLANKPGGFTDNDARVVSGFSELASIALINKRAEETIRRSEEYFRLLIENAMDVVTIVEADGTIRYQSPSIEHVLGYSRRDLVGRNAFEFVHPDDLQDARNSFSHLVHRPGANFFIQMRYLHKDRSWRILEASGKNLLDNPVVAGIVVTSRDITERNRAEQELIELTNELRRSNADLQQFAYAASHDLQEPLHVVAGFVKLLEKRYKDRLDEKAREFIDYSLEGVERMQMLIRDLLAYSQVGEKGKRFTRTSASEALETAIHNLHSALGESNAKVTYDLLPTVMADASQLSRLFQNLIGNALKFRSRERPEIHISAERKPNEWVFSVRDNGIGIAPKNLDRIFIVFQRLHSREEYEGTGIGLAICKRIVERHGGRIWAESEPGNGSVFFFSIPAH